MPYITRATAAYSRIRHLELRHRAHVGANPADRIAYKGDGSTQFTYERNIHLAIGIESGTHAMALTRGLSHRPWTGAAGPISSSFASCAQ